jgi:hypothetical protein
MVKKIAKDTLIRCAINGVTIDYIRLVKFCYGRYTWDLGGALYEILVKIGDEECQMGRPPINCLAVNTKEGSIPGAKFFYWYWKKFNQKKYLQDFSERKQLHDLLIKECHEYWQDVVAEPA